MTHTGPGTQAPATAEPSRPLMISVLRYAVAAGLLGLLFSQVPFADVAAVLRQTDLPTLLPAVLISLIVQWLIAYKLRLMADDFGIDITVAELLQINLATRFYGLFVPGGNVTGIAIRFYRIARTDRQYTETAVALLIERGLATLTLCLFGVVFYLATQAGTGNGLIMLAAVVCLILLIVAVAGLWHVVVSVLNRLAAWPGYAASRVLSKVRDAILHAGSLQHRTFVSLLGLSFAVHFLGVISYLFVGSALGLSLTFIMLAWVRSGMILATMIPISVAGIGLREVASVALLANLGAEKAVAFSLLVLAATILPAGLIGGVSEAWRFFSRSD